MVLQIQSFILKCRLALIGLSEVEKAISELGIKVIEIPREALFLAGKVFIKYKRNRGIKKSPLPDFFIGAHATVSKFDLMTRDSAKYKTYFPSLKLIHPDSQVLFTTF